MWTDSARAKYARPSKRYATDLTRCRVRAGRAPAAVAEPARPAAHHRSARGAGRDLLSAANGVPVGLLPSSSRPRARCSAISGAGGGTAPARPVLRPAGPGAAGGRPRGPADRGHRRQPVDENQRKRRPARLRRRQEDQRPQTACAGRHAGVPAAWHRPPRQRPGPRRARPAAWPHPPPFPLARACCSPTAAIKARSRPRRPATSGWRW